MQVTCETAVVRSMHVTENQLTIRYHLSLLVLKSTSIASKLQTSALAAI